MFHGNALFDQDARLILAPDGSFDKEADVLGPVADMIKDRIQVEIPPGEPYQATAAQAARARRILDQLRQRKVPTLDSFLHVEDDEAVTLRKPREVARRVLVLSAVSFLADGGPRDAALEMIDHADLWPAVSPEEKDFLEATRTDPEKAHKLLWRLEALWVLAWALGDLDLDWPSGMCDVPRLVKHVETYEGREDFIAKATLRPKTQILDAQQLTLLIHWAITDAFVHHRSVPADLDWSGNSDMVPVTQAPAVAVVEERHRALNWLTCLDNADWDHVDTST